MQGICSGHYPDGYRGISKKVACEFVKGQTNFDKLPTRLHPRKKKWMNTTEGKLKT